MFKRLILSVFLLCAVFPVCADVDYSSILAEIRSGISMLHGSLDSIDDYVYDIQLSYLDNLDSSVNSIDTQIQLLLLKVNTIKDTFENINTNFAALYPKLIQQYYHVITIDENTQSAVGELMSANMYLHDIHEVISMLHSVIEDYQQFKESITVPLNNIDFSNSEMALYVRSIYEDVDTIKALFLGEANLRAMLDALWDIKNDVEYFQQRWEAQNTDIHEMFLDPFDNSGFKEPYEASWNYFDRTFDPLWTWSNGTRFINVQSSNWGALDDICSGLLAILQGNEAMNYNLEYLCQGVTIIASNLMNGVNMEAKYNEFKNEFQERYAQIMQQFGSLSEYENGFSSVDSSHVTAIFDSQVQNFQNTFSRYSVQQLDDEAVVTLNGLQGFGANVSSVSGSLDMGSYSAFFVAARAVFGFLYWVIEFGFILWLIGKCLNLYKFTLRMFCSLPRQVSN